VFESIAKLSVFDQDVFRCLYEENLSIQEACLTLRPRFPERTFEQLGDAVGRIQQALTPRQRWLLSIRNVRYGQARKDTGEPDNLPMQVLSPAPDPELLASLQERRATLQHALSRLAERERLLIRLRFERELTLEQVARILHLGDAQCADRRIKEVLQKLRAEIESHEKRATVSV